MKKNWSYVFFLVIVAHTIFSKSLSAQGIRDPQVRLDSLIQKGNEMAVNNPKIAIKLGLEAVELAEKTEDFQKLQKAYSLLRNSYFYYGLMEEASYYSSKNYQIALENGTEQDLFFAKVNQGGIWYMLGKFDKAKEFFLDALKYMDGQPSNPADSLYASSMSAILNNLALSEINSKNFEKAREYAERGLDIARQNPKIPVDQIRILNNYAEILQNLNRWDEAKEILDEALKISKAIQSPMMEATTLYSLSRLYFQKNDLKNAVEATSMSFRLAREIESLSLEGALSALLYDEFKKLNMPDSVLKYRLIQERVDALSKFNSANELMLKEELQNEFKKTLAEANKKERIQNILFFYIILLCVAVISVLTYFFFQAKQKARESRMEKLKSDEIAHQKTEEVGILESVLKEKSEELSVQSLKKYEKDKRIEDLLKNLLSSQNSTSVQMNDAKQELKDKKQFVKEFDLIFEEVHSGFISKLQNEFPNLTLNERRLCAMLKLQLTTKEISQITHQSIRSIEITRTRLRKKLNLTNQTIRISDFLSSY